MLDTIPDWWYWDYRHQDVRFYAWRNSVQAAKKHFNDIADRFSDLLGQGRFEDDGSVLLRSTDW